MASATVSVISGSFGAGHDVAADELARRLEARGVATTRHDFVDLMGPRLGPALRSAYARQLAYAPSSWGWLLDYLRGGSGLRLAERLATSLAAGRTHDCTAHVDAVVSTYPLASLVLGKLRAQGRLTAPAITYLTDMSVHPLWVSPDIDLHIALHPLTAEQARHAGATDVVTAAPAVDRSRFHPLASPAQRTDLRNRFGLPQERQLALVASGSWGVGDVEATARDIALSGTAVPVVACGRNEALLRRLRAAGHGVVALGWVNDMGSLIRACDVVVTNAGGLTGLEAMSCGLPLITYRCLPGHGAANAEVLAAAGLAVHATDIAELAHNLSQAHDDARGAGARDRLPSAPDPAEVIVDRLRTGRAMTPAIPKQRRSRQLVGAR